VLLIAVLADWGQYADADLWMHVRFGQLALHSGSILRHDIFSYSAPGAPWFNHEWLSDVVFAFLYNLAGVPGLKLLKFLCAAATIVLIAIAMRLRRVSGIIETAVLILVALALAPQVQFRPQLFDYVFFSAMLTLFAYENAGSAAALWLAVPIMALWANLHGSFPVGAAVLGLYAAVAGLQDWLGGRGTRRLLRLSAVAAAAILATLLNPFGIDAWRVALAKSHEPIIAMNLNLEFRSLFSYIANGERGAWVFSVIIMIAGIASFLLARDLEDLPMIAIAALMTCASIYAVRNMAFAVIAWSAPLARHLRLFLPRKTGSSSDLGGQLIVAAGAAALAIMGGLFSASLATGRPAPAGAVAFMQRHRLHGNILAEYSWGGYVIWHMVPPSRVFFDTFDERYPESVQVAYVEFMGGRPDQMEQILRKYPHDYLLLPSGSPPAQAMTNISGWKLLYRDPVAALFGRIDSPVAQQSSPDLNPYAPATFFP
jgi:hypothetical protein